MTILRLVRCQDCSRICNFSRRLLNFISKSSIWNLTVWCHWANITFKCKKFGIHKNVGKIVSNWCSTIFNWYSTSFIVTRCLQMLLSMSSIASRRLYTMCRAQAYTKWQTNGDVLSHDYICKYKLWWWSFIFHAGSDWPTHYTLACHKADLTNYFLYKRVLHLYISCSIMSNKNSSNQKTWKGLDEI